MVAENLVDQLVVRRQPRGQAPLEDVRLPGRHPVRGRQLLLADAELVQLRLRSRENRVELARRGSGPVDGAHRHPHRLAEPAHRVAGHLRRTSDRVELLLLLLDVAVTEPALDGVLRVGERTHQIHAVPVRGGVEAVLEVGHCLTRRLKARHGAREVEVVHGALGGVEGVDGFVVGLRHPHQGSRDGRNRQQDGPRSRHQRGSQLSRHQFQTAQTGGCQHRARAERPQRRNQRKSPRPQRAGREELASHRERQHSRHGTRKRARQQVQRTGQQRRHVGNRLQHRSQNSYDVEDARHGTHHRQGGTDDVGQRRGYRHQGRDEVTDHLGGGGRERRRQVGEHATDKPDDDLEEIAGGTGDGAEEDRHRGEPVGQGVENPGDVLTGAGKDLQRLRRPGDDVPERPQDRHDALEPVSERRLPLRGVEELAHVGQHFAEARTHPVGEAHAGRPDLVQDHADVFHGTPHATSNVPCVLEELRQPAGGEPALHRRRQRLRRRLHADAHLPQDGRERGPDAQHRGQHRRGSLGAGVEEPQPRTRRLLQLAPKHRGRHDRGGTNSEVAQHVTGLGYAFREERHQLLAHDANSRRELGRHRPLRGVLHVLQRPAREIGESGGQHPAGAGELVHIFGELLRRSFRVHEGLHGGPDPREPQLDSPHGERGTGHSARQSAQQPHHGCHARNSGVRRCTEG